VTVRRERHGSRGRPGRVQPFDVEPLRALHLDTLATGPLVVLRDREEQVAEASKAGVGAV